MKSLSSNELSVINDANLESCSYASGLIALGFAARNVAHMAHLSVTGPGSFAAHKALDNFYSSVIDLVDSYAENYQGRYGLITCYPRVLSKCDSPACGLEAIQTLRNWIDANRSQCGEASEIQNIIDEIVSLCNGTIYLLTTLS